MALLSASPARAGYCYSVFDQAGRVVLQGTEAPVDVTRPYSDALRDAGLDGHHLVVADLSDCPTVPGPGGPAARRGRRSEAGKRISRPAPALCGRHPRGGIGLRQLQEPGGGCRMGRR
ncbi:MAG: hypothetical protein MZW92_26005 [Comamonadaceae bacterium]|nr:hypothetical protein [Comamonadaceae bacterium]